jgi:hypothetical protein
MPTPRRRGRPPGFRPRLTLRQVRAWAEAHHGRTGRWPTRDTGPVAGARGETWDGIARALRRGWRGLPVGLSLAWLRDADPAAVGALDSDREQPQPRNFPGRDAAMRRERAAGATLVGLAAKYGVSRQRVHQIVGAKPTPAPPGTPARRSLGR